MTSRFPEGSLGQTWVSEEELSWKSRPGEARDSMRSQSCGRRGGEWVGGACLSP